MKFNNLRYTANVLVLAISLSLTGCGKKEKQTITEEPILTEPPISVEQPIRTEQEVRKEILSLEQELREIQEANYQENYAFINTLSNFSGVDVTYYDDGRIFSINVTRKQVEDNFITILNCLSSSTCYDLEQLTIEDCNLLEYSKETQQLFQTVMLSLSSKDIYKLQLNNMNLEDISFLNNPNFKEKLYILELFDNQITDISSISNLQNIKILNLSNNNIFDISTLVSLPKLETVSLYNNNLTNLEIVTELMNDGVNIYYASQPKENWLENILLDKYTYPIDEKAESEIITDYAEIYYSSEVNENGKCEVKVKIIQR